MDEKRVSVGKLMEEIRSEVERKRVAGEYPEDWFLEADPDSEDPERRDDLEANLRRANATVLIERNQTFPGEGAVERAAGIVKRAIRRSILFHTNFVADQADVHNAAVVRVLNKMYQAMDDIQRRVADSESSAVEFQQRLANLGEADLVKRVDAIERSMRERGLLP